MSLFFKKMSLKLKLLQEGIVIQNFVHPEITEDSPVDPVPFEPPNLKNFGFSGTGALCSELVAATPLD